MQEGGERFFEEIERCPVCSGILNIECRNVFINEFIQLNVHLFYVVFKEFVHCLESNRSKTL